MTPRTNAPTDIESRRANSIPSALQTSVPVSKIRFWAGWIISALPALFLLSGGVNGIRKADFVVAGASHLGYPESTVVTLGIIQLVCALLYLFPPTAILGAVLLTGYLGGATASHIRVGEPAFAPLVFAVIVWLGLWLRDDRPRIFLPSGRRPVA